MAADANRRERRGRDSPAQSPTIQLVVGIGALAGGLEAFTSSFAHMPPKSGMAFVMVQHLNPHHESLLVELLGKRTAMPVIQADDGMAVAADRVFVIPPNAVLTIEGGLLRVATPAPAREQRRRSTLPLLRSPKTKRRRRGYSFGQRQRRLARPEGDQAAWRRHPGPSGV